MKPNFLALISIVVLGGIGFSDDVPALKPKVTIVLNREGAVYRQGEMANFTVVLLQGDKPAKDAELQVSLTVDTARVLKTEKVNYKGTPLIYSATLNEPGFIRCRVTYRPPTGNMISAQAGAGFDPLKIKPSLPVPDDFESFWQSQKAKLATVKMTVLEMTPVKKNASLEMFDVKIASLGDQPVSGYFARPLQRKPKSLPAILWPHGGGVRTSNSGRAMNGARMGCLSMDINAHGLPNGMPKEFYAALNRGALAGYRTAGREDRETVYFKGMYLRLVRAIDFLTSQPEWDGKTVMVCGHSQGGAQALIAAGLDQRVTAIGAGISALCDHSGMVLGRVVGWPRLVQVKNGKPDPTMLQVARYYDVLNFATLIKADVIMTVGFIDDSCKPTTVYAAYNAIPSPKKMIPMPEQGHRAPSYASTAFSQFLKAHIEKMK